MSSGRLRFRHSFQDFHTSPDIPDVGGEFDPDEFIATLKKARVDSVTLCARCHHGHLYYDSKVHPELIHPQLARPNFLLEQIEACQKNDIRVTIYTTVEFDFFMTEEHPEWLAVNADGSPHSLKIAEDGEGGHRHTTASPYDAGFYRWLCLNSPTSSF
jgi:hypothetical protein